ncbi:helix-turn-helix domain-containing protein [Moraxella bovis]|uniref:Helix-turn-helix domain-containing protein n=1 Tax=Moraxella bovis TaxID=476 RepID=A0AAQ2T233_MORBO|nr:helix-turn-helix transcriptional regulator [Moraxella bovis]AWY19469.1 transcriptional regulator [Moraxella bovis]UYZ76183.1 helix-turn-helix domain-containing protein [Moraxella bovis]UYZ77863.1 helix-turn-helix domain-containing protein [Moraxella bovis]UYZ80758.1 helix-turn-helix domain-containing protein [Moraxella bovis]UYZ86349.1 helix-turn-helix domain-containing protein [Moraxella bovis]
MHTNTNQKICQPTREDWHQADIVASLKKAGTNLSALSEKHGYSRNNLRNALYRKYPKAEQIIAQAIGVAPEEIWPSRYA